MWTFTSSIDLPSDAIVEFRRGGGGLSDLCCCTEILGVCCTLLELASWYITDSFTGDEMDDRLHLHHCQSNYYLYDVIVFWYLSVVFASCCQFCRIQSSTPRVPVQYWLTNLSKNIEIESFCWHFVSMYIHEYPFFYKLNFKCDT